MGLPRERSLDRYELLIELARGGMAELFLARLPGVGGFEKRIAIKRILPHLAQDRQFVELFLNEGRIAAHLSHPNVCQVYELGETGGELFLTMEYLEGVSWEQLLAAAPREAAVALAAGVIGQAAEGLHYAHTLRDTAGQLMPVVHRDVSPQNLFVTVDGVCKVLDFGVAKMMRDGPRTRSGVIKGKLPYMAPEQIRGEPVDARADVFSLGVCTWEAFTGERLFDRESDYLIWKAITEEDVPPIASRWPACPRLVDAVVRRALSKEREQRQATARGFAGELRNAANGAAGAAEIAEAVRSWCGERIAARRREIAEAVGASGGGAAGGAGRGGGGGRGVDEQGEQTEAGETVSMLMRRESIAIRREAPAPPPAEHAPRQPESLQPGSLQPGSPQRGSLQPGSLQPAPRAEAAASSGRSRSHLVTAIVAAGVAAAVTAIVVVAMTRGERGGAPDAPAPVASAPPDAGAALAIEAVGLQTGIRALEQLGTLRDEMTALRERLAPIQRAGEAIGAAAARTPGTYEIESEPPATIYVDDKRLGETPLRAPLAAGTHTIRAVLADGRERSFTVEIEAGEETRAEPLRW